MQCVVAYGMAADPLDAQGIGELAFDVAETDRCLGQSLQHR